MFYSLFTFIDVDAFKSRWLTIEEKHKTSLEGNSNISVTTMTNAHNKEEF